LWLVSHNKLLTRDNPEKRQTVLDKTCLLCNENETVEHLFFSCDILRIMWTEISIILQKEIGLSFENVARLWVSNKKNVVTNMVVAAIMWSTWKHRNDMFFGRCIWSDAGFVEESGEAVEAIMESSLSVEESEFHGRVREEIGVEDGGSPDNLKLLKRRKTMLMVGPRTSEMLAPRLMLDVQLSAM
jgi:hypothetical protein